MMSIFTPNRNYLRRQWLDAHHMFGVDADMEEFEFVFNSYREAWRRYHGLRHLVHGLKTIHLILGADPEKLPMREIALVMFAYFYHDVIMGGKDNEAASALRAAHYLARFMSSLEIERIKALIRATADHQGSKLTDPLWPILNDADLAILSAPTKVYRQYAENIWLEYRPMVKREDFVVGRTKFLGEFTKRRVYKTPVFEAKEYIAYDNMVMEIIDLNQS